MEIESFTYLKFLLALVFVLGLIGVLAVIARRLGLGHRVPIGRGKDRRLSVVEAMPLDAKRRIMLIRRDDREHLIMLGAGGEQVIEAGIAGRPAMAAEKEPVGVEGK